MYLCTGVNPSRLLVLAAAIVALGACGGSGTSSSGGAVSSSSSSGSSSSSSSSSGATSDCEPASQGDGYCLVWRDEFQQNVVDENLWSYEYNCYGGGNNEAQCYVRDDDNVWVDGEYLHVKAIAEPTTGPAVSDDDPNYDEQDTSGSGSFSSGRLRSIGKGDWRYGRFEVRAKLPAGQGTWPAIWMLPTEWVYGGWASSGEIDIIEAVNLKVGGENRIHGTLHFGDNWPNNVYAGTEYELPGGANPADDFHEYAIEWEEGEIRWYVDGDHYATQTSAGWYSAAALDEPHAPFNQRFHLILNLAVGGDWAGQVNDTGIDVAAFPQELVVDYVRVYSCSKDPQTGKGCGSSDGEFVANPGVTPPTPVDVGGPELVIFTDTVAAPYQWYFWAESGAVTYDLVAAGERGVVAQWQFDTDNGIGFYQSQARADISDYSAIEFDLRVVEEPVGGLTALQYRADCVYPCSSGAFELPYPGRGIWRSYRLPLAELSSAGLQLDSVDTPLVISPPVGQQRGAVIQVDNVRLTR